MSNAVREKLSGGAIDTLIALVENGPLWDGDVPSKSGRDELLKLGFAAKIVVKAEEGYQAATYAGAQAYREHFGEPSIREAMAHRKANFHLSRAIHHGRND